MHGYLFVFLFALVMSIYFSLFLPASAPGSNSAGKKSFPFSVPVHFPAPSIMRNTHDRGISIVPEAEGKVSFNVAHCLLSRMLMPNKKGQKRSNKTTLEPRSKGISSIVEKSRQESKESPWGRRLKNVDNVCRERYRIVWWASLFFNLRLVLFFYRSDILQRLGF